MGEGHPPGALFLGVDGGGSRTVALVADAAGHILGRGLAGPGNLHSAGEAGAEQALRAAIDAALSQAGAKRERVEVACLGLAGAGRAPERAFLRRWAQAERLAARVLVVADCDLVLAAGTAEGWGLALIAGTGSVAWGRGEGPSPTPRECAALWEGEAPAEPERRHPAGPWESEAPAELERRHPAGPGEGEAPREGEAPAEPRPRERRPARAGGWGYLLGDEGSGYALGLGALGAIAHAADGLGPPTALHDAILAHWHLAAPQALIARVYREPSPRAEIAALAPLVEWAAGDGDPVARRLVAEAGTALARILDAVARRLEFGHGQAVPCALGGGLLVHGRWVREEALRAAAALGWRLEPVVRVEEPALGALRLARGEVPIG